LVSQSGEPLGDSVSSSLKGGPHGQSKKLNSRGIASFNLEMMNKELDKRKLEFVVEADLQGKGSIRQTICSKPFSIYGGSHPAWTTPCITRINPSKEHVDEKTLVCIVGSRFSKEDKIKVLFGEKEAKIVEHSPGLLVCRPPMLDLTKGPQQVDVKVINMGGTTHESAPVSFEYL